MSVKNWYEQLSYDFDSEIEKTARRGHWRRLDPEDVGHDESGNEVRGRTWVQSRLRPKYTPMKHQRRFIEAATKQPGVLALHGTGTGKTFSAIAAFEKTKGQGKSRRALVVAPAGLRDNFMAKGINRFTDSRATIMKRPGPVDPGTEYVVVSYAAFRRNPDAWLRAVKPDTLIADELHKASNPESSNYKALMHARQRTPRFMGLTASAVQNDPSDIVPLLQLATAGNHPIKTRKQFRRQFMESRPSEERGIFGGKQRKQRVINVQKLKENIGPAVHYIEDLDAKSKPPKYTETVEVKMSPRQIKLYRWSMRGIDPKTRLKIQRGESVSQREAMNVFMKLMRARQVSNSLAAVDSSMGLAEAAEKTPKIKRILDDAEKHLRKTPDGQIVMYSNFYRGSVDVLKAGLEARGISYGVFAGAGRDGITQQSRQQDVDSYLAGEKKVIIITGAGAEGLSLGNTTMVQVVDGHYNPERTAQAEARGVRAGGQSHRPEAKRRVDVKRYVSTLPKGFWKSITFQKRERGVDEWVYRTAERKAKMNRQLREALSDTSRHHEKRRDNPLYRAFVRRP